MLSFIPDSLKQALVDGLVNFLAGQADRIADGTLGARLRGLTSDGALRRQIEAALRRAVVRFEREYGAIDQELVAEIRAVPEFWQQPKVHQAITDMISRPGTWMEQEREQVLNHFASVLPTHPDRARIDRAVAHLLRCAAEEIWAIPAAKEIREIYALQMQRHSAEAMQRQLALAEQRLALVEAEHAQLQLPAPAPVTRPRPWHNLPPIESDGFRGRGAELARLYQLLAPNDRTWQILVLGMGGVGKSSLVRAVAQEYIDQYATLPEAERFEAVIWVSAKEEALTALGMVPAAPDGLIFHTLDDIYSAIAAVLDRADLAQAAPAERDRLAQQALAAQRTLLIVDNFESVSDERVRAFLRHLPPPTKALITSREWIDAAATIRLGGLSSDEALALLQNEAERRGMSISPSHATAIVVASGGIPLALRLSVARLESGERPEAVLRWLDSAGNDVAAYCVQSQAELARARNSASWSLLLACAFCDRDAGGARTALGAAAGLDEATCDGAAILLQRLSLLVSLPDDRLTLLPLVERYVQRAATPEELRTVGERSLQWAQTFAATTAARLDQRIELVAAVAREYPNLRAAIGWCRAYGRHAEIIELVRHSWFYAELAGRFDELQSMVQAALEAAQTLGDVSGQAFALRQLAWVGRIQGQALAPTLARLQEAEGMAKQANDAALLADIWYITSDLREQQGDLAGAELLAKGMLTIAERRNDHRIRALGAYRLAKFALRRDDSATALRWLETADDAATQLGWRRQLAWNSYRRGVTYLATREFMDAENALIFSLNEARVWDERRLQAYALQRLVEVYAATGQRAQAMAIAEDARARFMHQGIERHDFTQLIERLRGEDTLLADLLAAGSTPI